MGQGGRSRQRGEGAPEKERRDEDAAQLPTEGQSRDRRQRCQTTAVAGRFGRCLGGGTLGLRLADLDVGLTCWRAGWAFPHSIISLQLYFSPSCSFALRSFNTGCRVLAVMGTTIPSPFFVESCRGQTLPKIAEGGGGWMASDIWMASFCLLLLLTLYFHLYPIQYNSVF